MMQKRTHQFDRVGKLEAVWSGCSTRNSRRTWAILWDIEDCLE